MGNRDHPRACGEQLARPTRCATCPGSSPRVRGAGSGAVVDANEVGIIPARAGSRPFTTSWYPACRDHPRACGEQHEHTLGHVSRMGSSPRVRGAGHRESLLGGDAGIIPARAGSRPDYSGYVDEYRDHPRACGEQTLAIIEPFSNQGSSPRVRGAAYFTKSAHKAAGIIPARAGSRLKNPSSKHPIPLMWTPF